MGILAPAELNCEVLQMDYWSHFFSIKYYIDLLKCGLKKAFNFNGLAAPINVLELCWAQFVLIIEVLLEKAPYWLYCVLAVS